jgi:DNA-binding IclR family transcriptional regulator
MPLYPVKSAERAIRVLELFQHQQQPLTLHEVASQLRTPVPSTLAILKTLAGMGYLVFDVRRKTYFPALRLVNLGDWVSGQFFENSPVLAVAERLREETSEHVLVSMQNDLHVLYVRILQGTGGERGSAKECGSQLVVNSASGLALLGTMADRSIDRICRRINIASQPAGRWIEPDKIIDLVRKFDRQGYGVLTGIPHPNRMYLSMLMPPTRSGKRFAISVGGHRARLTRQSDRLLNKMYETIAAA